MRDRSADTSRIPRILAGVLPVLVVGVAACGTAGPPKRDYVLGAAPTSSTVSLTQTALPVIQLERVLLPDYLDTRDIVTRSDNQIVPSQTGRWAERLSVGIARALAASLARRLTRMVVISGEPIKPPALRILVDVIDFEPTAEHQVVVAARWTITDGSGQTLLATEHAALTEPVTAPGGDSAIVAAMSLALEKLADRIAAGVASRM